MEQWLKKNGFEEYTKGFKVSDCCVCAVLGAWGERALQATDSPCHNRQKHGVVEFEDLFFMATHDEPAVESLLGSKLKLRAGTFLLSNGSRRAWRRLRTQKGSYYAQWLTLDCSQPSISLSLSYAHISFSDPPPLPHTRARVLSCGRLAGPRLSAGEEAQ